MNRAIDIDIWVHAQMGGPIWVSCKPIMPCDYYCNAHVAL
jgi:hypothetical protein